MENTALVMERLAKAGFMINLKKSHLCYKALKILGHHWTSGGYWLPEPAKLEALLRASEDELRKIPRSRLFGLLNFYREYVPQFSELSEPIRRLLGNTQLPWNEKATESVRSLCQIALAAVPWLAFDPSKPVHAETRLNPEAISLMLL